MALLLTIMSLFYLVLAIIISIALYKYHVSQAAQNKLLVSCLELECKLLELETNGNKL